MLCVGEDSDINGPYILLVGEGSGTMAQIFSVREGSGTNGVNILCVREGYSTNHHYILCAGQSSSVK